MLSRRTSLRTAVAVLGAGTVLALTMSSPAFAVEGDFQMPSTPNCDAVQKIEPRLYTDGQYHDFQAIDPTRTNGHCEFLIWDSSNGRPVYDSISGSQSPWIYDGPGHSVRTEIIDHLGGKLSWGIYN
ncbi:hypothetical protein OG500_37415 [Kitasatospora sp. NBC_01250]|uniref:hypothetical protein n=1 Tax=unclassified Kitasatospora TaxID=2633591 RepID=UPI002E1146FB|nr:MULTISPECIES: hypothetical protein [unclassified Kitasatospora]WSJ71627.1 hypothetical protein OG294_39110 [Kitasatospora sp. NBC_01302]